MKPSSMLNQMRKSDKSGSLPSNDLPLSRTKVVVWRYLMCLIMIINLNLTPCKHAWLGIADKISPLNPLPDTKQKENKKSYFECLSISQQL